MLFEGLKFHAGNTFIHKMDPRVKFLLSMYILTLAVIYTDIYVLTVLIVIQAVMASIGKVLRNWSRTIRGATPLAVLVFVLNLIFIASTENFSISIETIYRSLVLAYRLLVFLSSFSIFFLTTTPEEIGMTLVSWKIPYQYTFAFISAIRFTPIVGQELRNIMDAQRARGLELDKGGPIERARRMIPILVPLLANSLRRAYELAEAMEIKCFGASKKRTYLRELKIKPSDYIILILSTLAFAIAILVKILPLTLSL